MTLYRNFASKDELIVAFLAAREERWTRGWLQAEVERRADDARGAAAGDLRRLRRVVRAARLRGLLVHQRDARADRPRGPGRVASVKHLSVIREFLAGLAAEAGVAGPRGVRAPVAHPHEGLDRRRRRGRRPWPRGARRTWAGCCWPRTACTEDGPIGPCFGRAGPRASARGCGSTGRTEAREERAERRPRARAAAAGDAPAAPAQRGQRRRRPAARARSARPPRRRPRRRPLRRRRPRPSTLSPRTSRPRSRPSRPPRRRSRPRPRPPPRRRRRRSARRRSPRTRPRCSRSPKWTRENMPPRAILDGYLDRTDVTPDAKVATLGQLAASVARMEFLLGTLYHQGTEGQVGEGQQRRLPRHLRRRDRRRRPAVVHEVRRLRLHAAGLQGQQGRARRRSSCPAGGCATGRPRARAPTTSRSRRATRPSRTPSAPAAR